MKKKKLNSREIGLSQVQESSTTYRHNNLNAQVINKIIAYPNELENFQKTIDDLLEKGVCNQQETTVTAAIIVKNEERCILRCLNSILHEFDELVIVDTGSTDNTIPLINSIDSPKIRLYTKAWEDDFSSIRNYALEKVTSDWVFFIDADEFFCENDISIKTLLSAFSYFPYISRTVFCPKIVDADGHTSIGIARIFKTGVGISYHGLVHEELRTNNAEGNCLPYMVSLDIPIEHDGYIPDIMHHKQKEKRNTELLEKMLLLEPNNIRWIYFYLRDAQKSISVELVEEYIFKHLLIDNKKPMTIDNLVNSPYTYAILTIYASKSLFYESYTEKTRNVLSLMNALEPDNNTNIYFETILEINLLQKQQFDLLKKVMNYRKEHLDSQYGSLHSEGKNIDLLIGYLLFKTGYIEKALKYFNLLEDIFADNPLLLECKTSMDKIVKLCK